VQDSSHTITVTRTAQVIYTVATNPYTEGGRKTRKKFREPQVRQNWAKFGKTPALEYVVITMIINYKVIIKIRIRRAFLFQRLSVFIKRYNAVAVLGTFTHSPRGRNVAVPAFVLVFSPRDLHSSSSSHSQRGPSRRSSTMTASNDLSPEVGRCLACVVSDLVDPCTCNVGDQADDSWRDGKTTE